MANSMRSVIGNGNGLKIFPPIGHPPKWDNNTMLNILVRYTLEYSINKANNPKTCDDLKHLLAKIPKFMDGALLDLLDFLMPWSDSLLDICRKTK